MKSHPFFLSRAVLLACLLAFPAFAQTTGSLKGIVSSTDGQPLPGATLEAKGPSLQGSRIGVSGGDGRFALSLLPPGNYEVSATLAGFATKVQKVTLGLDKVAELKFELPLSQSANVTVTADAGQIETTSNAIGRDLDQKVFELLPTGRNFSSLAQLETGVNTDDSDSRNPAITVYGATGLENAFLVDGVNTTGIEFGNQGKSLNFEFVQEVELKTGGYEAEYGHAIGGIVNVVTKSGGNEFHGDLFGYLNRDSLQANSKHEGETTAQGVPTGFRKSDFGADLGGYILKDQLWFFAAYDRVINTQDTLVTQGSDAGNTTNLRTTGDLYSGKLTWHLGTNHTIVATVFGDPTKDSGAVVQPIGPPTTYGGTSSVGGSDLSLRYEGILNPKWLVTAQIGRHHEHSTLLPGPGGDQICAQDLTGDVVTASGGFCGNNGNGQFDDKKFTRGDYRLDSTLYVGNHDIKGGFEFEHITADVTRSFSGGQLLLNLGQGAIADHPDDILYEHIFFASAGSPNCCPPDGSNAIVSAPLVARPNHDVISAFLQDNWKPLPNLTVNAGLRYEKQLIRGFENQTFINIGHFSPRLGFSWDITKDGKTKVFGSYGQFVQAIPLDMNIRSLNGERDGAIFNFDPVSLAFDPNAFTDDTPSVIRGSPGNPADLIDPHLKAQYQEEILIGIDRQFGPNLVLGLHGIYRRLRRVIEDTYVPDANNYAFTNPGETTTACGAAGCFDISQFHFPPAHRYFRGIEVTAQKRLSNRWMLFASYLYSQLKGNYDGGFREIGGFNAKDPNITDDFDYPEFVVNSYGKLTIDRPHQAKAQVAYAFPFNLTASLSAYYSSGTPLSRVGWWNGYGGPEVFITTRGSEGHSPNVYETDVHLDYALTFQPVTIHILADVFNLLNRQTATEIDQVWDFDQGDNTSPTPTNSHYGKPNAFQSPRTLRLGVRASF